MRNIVFCTFLLGLSAILFSCENRPGANTTADGDSPTDAYKRLYAAVKAKNTEAIQAVMTKGSMEFAKANAARTNQTIEQVLANGFTATTFSSTLPQIRDERVDGDMGAVEVFNSKDNRWEDLPFIREDGNWKLAIGELWFGRFKSPGKGQSQKEAEAANAASNQMKPMNIQVNGNFKGVHPPLANTNANSK